MQRTLRLAPLTLLATFPILLGLRPQAEEYDLSVRYTVGQRFALTEQFEFAFALEELSIEVDGTPLADEGAVSVEATVKSEFSMTEEVLELRDGTPSKLRLAVTKHVGSFEMSGDAMGETMSESEGLDVDFSGRTLEVTTAEDGEATVVDVTEDMEPLSEEELEQFGHSGHYVELLPKRPLEVGATFDIAEGWEDMVDELLAELEVPDAELDAQELQAAREVVDALLRSATVVATGELAAVEGRTAKLVYTMQASLAVDDLLERFKGVLPIDELDELPPGITSEFALTLDVQGRGSFDLELGQLTELELGGELSLRMAVGAELEGTAMNADVTFGGSFSLSASNSAL